MTLVRSLFASAPGVSLRLPGCPIAEFFDEAGKYSAGLLPTAKRSAGITEWSSKMKFYVVFKAGRFFIKETKEPFHQSKIDAFHEQGWELHGPFPSRRQAKDKVHEVFRVNEKGNEGD
jgi:hypothetical protein